MDKIQIYTTILIAITMAADLGQLITGEGRKALSHAQYFVCFLIEILLWIPIFGRIFGKW
jgi:hypothetical protein